MSTSPTTPPRKYAIALFQGFQALDAFEVLDTLNVLSGRVPLELAVVGPTTGPVSTLHDPSSNRVSQQVVPTHTYANCPDDIEVLIVPGGLGTRNPDLVRPTIEFLRERYSGLRYLLTVCTGSALAAQAGILDGRRATSNKIEFSWVVSHGPNVCWVREARWVVDGNIWTSSGMSAGLDMFFAFVEAQYGSEMADHLAIGAEYSRNKDSTVDPFAKYAV